jgi:hypothetical protein
MQTRFSHPFAVIPLPGVLFVTDTSSEAHLPGQRDSRHDHVDTLASDNLGSRETEDCANPGDRVHVHQPRAPEVLDNATSFQRHLEDDLLIFPSPSTKCWHLRNDDTKATDEGLNLGLLGGEEGLEWGGGGRREGCPCKPSTSTATFISSLGSPPPPPSCRRRGAPP